MKFNIIHIPSVDSTNNYAVQQVVNSESNEGDVIITTNQKKGKGQGANNWESEPGSNLTFSLVLKPKFVTPSNQFVLTQVISLAISDLIIEHLKSVDDGHVKIKWPNDIYINEKKVAGILIQNFIVGNSIDYSIVGIGLNINQREFISDARNPVSLIHHLNRKTDINSLLDELLEKISSRYEVLKMDYDFSKLRKEYLDRLFKMRSWSKYRDDKGDFEGKIVDVDEFGRLEISTRSGNTRIYMFKEVEFVL